MIALIVIGANSRDDTVQAVSIILGIVTFFVGVIGGVIGARIVIPSRIEHPYLWIRGAGREFLATLSAAR
ncbi:MAG TPA: hypothetical protein VFE47_30670 [Tepidisphaeraceae bacterium]|nr:hypothetical protein [Tepidisphaeraceae bacterium]